MNMIALKMLYFQGKITILANYIHKVRSSIISINNPIFGRDFYRFFIISREKWLKNSRFLREIKMREKCNP